MTRIGSSPYDAGRVPPGTGDDETVDATTVDETPDARGKRNA
jgi:hypothetical protein